MKAGPGPRSFKTEQTLVPDSLCREIRGGGQRRAEFPEIIGNTVGYETSGGGMKGTFDADTRRRHI